MKSNIVEKVLIKADVKRETEKAVMVELPFSLTDGEPRYAKSWLPKSQINLVGDNYEVPCWLIGKKLAEISERFQCSIISTLPDAASDGFAIWNV